MSRAKTCDSCKKSIAYEKHKLTPFSEYAYKKHKAAKWAKVRWWSNIIMKRLPIPYKCALCNFNCKLHVCHIKPISSYTEDTLCGVINHPNNLIYLCPNHHVLFDSGVIDIKGNVIDETKCNCKYGEVILHSK